MHEKNEKCVECKSKDIRPFHGSLEEYTQLQKNPYLNWFLLKLCFIFLKNLWGETFFWEKSSPPTALLSVSLRLVPR